MRLFVIGARPGIGVRSGNRGSLSRYGRKPCVHKPYVRKPYIRKPYVRKPYIRKPYAMAERGECTLQEYDK
jgi:hypothetical protein